MWLGWVPGLSLQGCLCRLLALVQTFQTVFCVQPCLSCFLGSLWQVALADLDFAMSFPALSSPSGQIHRDLAVSHCPVAGRSGKRRRS